METIDLTNFYSGGSYLIRADNPNWGAPFLEGFPEKLISLSTCVCPRRLSVVWGWEPLSRDRQTALDFGIEESQFNEFVSWCQSAVPSEIDIWSVFPSPLFAQRFIKRFISNTDDLHLIGIGLAIELLDIWDYGQEHKDGVTKTLESKTPLEEGGVPLGFEIVSFQSDFSHSWLCSGIHKDMDELFGIQVNARGLIDSYQDAKKVHDWIAEDEMQGRRSEPEPYTPWLFVSYPLEPATQSERESE